MLGNNIICIARDNVIRREAKSISRARMKKDEYFVNCSIDWPYEEYGWLRASSFPKQKILTSIHKNP